MKMLSRLFHVVLVAMLLNASVLAESKNLVITRAAADLVTHTVTIQGENFFGENGKREASIFLGRNLLTIAQSSPTRILAQLPLDLAPGTYLLIVSCGTSNDQFYAMDLTVGAVGLRGDKGEKGDKGDKGDAGVAAAKGDKGDKGDAGVAGAKSDKGDKGDPGVAGDKGDQGIQGIQGLAGVKGDKGDTGATGPAGPAGANGGAGPQGPGGPQGPAGPTGTQGPAGSVEGALSSLVTMVGPNLGDQRINSLNVAPRTWRDIPGRTLNFTKRFVGSKLRITYQDTLGTNGSTYDGCNWQIVLDGTPIGSFSAGDLAQGSFNWRMQSGAHVFWATGTTGSHTIVVQNRGNRGAWQNFGDGTMECLTGWNTTGNFLSVEEIP